MTKYRLSHHVIFSNGLLVGPSISMPPFLYDQYSKNKSTVFEWYPITIYSLDIQHQLTLTIPTLSSDIIISMKTIITATLSIIGGWLGWWLGNHIGLFTALLLSMIGTGIGIYVGRRFAQQFD